MVAELQTDITTNACRIRLRRAREEDAQALAAMMSGGISARLASWPDMMTPAMARARLARDLAEGPRVLPMVMELREDGAVCGWMSVTRLAEEPGCGILTYWLGEAHHGRGLMREVAPGAVRTLFAELRLERLRAAVQADNAASIRVLRAAGLRYLGPGRIWCGARGREESCLWYEMDRAMALGVAVRIGHSEDHAGVPER